MTIAVYDPDGGTGRPCEGHMDEEAMFVLVIGTTEHHLCPRCLGTIAKMAIDGLT